MLFFKKNWGGQHTVHPRCNKKRGLVVRALIKWAKRVGLACQTQQHLSFLFSKFFSMNGNFYILSKNIYLYLDYYPFSLLFCLESLIEMKKFFFVMHLISKENLLIH